MVVLILLTINFGYTQISLPKIGITMSKTACINKPLVIKLLPKMTCEHVYLTQYSVMNVWLAAQVLSTTVSKVLSNYGPADAAGTAEFCLMFDKFFDNMNVSSTTASSSQ